MKHFNMKRFAHVLSYTFSTSRRNLLSGMLGMLMCYLLMFFVANFSYKDTTVNSSMVVDQAYDMSSLCTLIFVMLSVGTIFRPEESKQGRTALMLLPASNLEKFLGRWVYLWVYTQAGCLMFAVADGLNYVYQLTHGQEALSALSCLVEVGKTSSLTAREVAMWRLSMADLFLVFMAVHAFYLLGSTLLRRYAFIVTSAVLALLVILWFWHFESLFSALSAERLLWLLFAFAIVCIILFTWLAYRAFCHWQLITRKYLSL